MKDAPGHSPPAAARGARPDPRSPWRCAWTRAAWLPLLFLFPPRAAATPDPPGLAPAAPGLLASATAPAPAAARPAAPDLAVRAVPCVTEILALEALLAALRVEVPMTIGPGGSVGTAEEGAAFYVHLSCPAGDTIDLFVTRRAPPAAAQERVPLSDVAADARPRALALAIAERLRGLDAKFAPAPAWAPTPAQARRLRLTGGLTIGLGALSLASTVIGAGLYGISTSGPEVVRPTELGPAGISLLSLGGAAFVGGGVTLTLWVLERRRVARAASSGDDALRR